MRTRDSSAVLGSSWTFLGTVLLFSPKVVFSIETFPPVLLLREQRFSGCSLKIWSTQKASD